MIAKIGRTLLAFLGLTSVASTALAQGNTFNPYGNSGYADYREFGNPMYSNNPALPGQSVLNSTPLVGRPRANSFQDYTNELDGLDPSAGRRGASGNLPYYQAYQRLNSDYNRVYRANGLNKKDQEFYDRQKQRETVYAEAMREKDPAKRAKLLREVDRLSLGGSGASDRPAATKGAPAPKPNAAPSTTARATAPVERRQPAPSPFSTDRSGSNRPATRAPAPAAGRSTPAPPPPSTRPATPRTRPAPDPSTIPVPPPR